MSTITTLLFATFFVMIKIAAVVFVVWLIACLISAARGPQRRKNYRVGRDVK